MSFCFYNFYNSKVKKNIQLRWEDFYNSKVKKNIQLRWEDFYNMGTLAAAAK